MLKADKGKALIKSGTFFFSFLFLFFQKSNSKHKKKHFTQRAFQFFTSQNKNAAFTICITIVSHLSQVSYWPLVSWHEFWILAVFLHVHFLVRRQDCSRRSGSYSKVLELLTKHLSFLKFCWTAMSLGLPYIYQNLSPVIFLSGQSSSLVIEEDFLKLSSWRASQQSKQDIKYLVLLQTMPQKRIIGEIYSHF